MSLRRLDTVQEPSSLVNRSRRETTLAGEDRLGKTQPALRTRERPRHGGLEEPKAPSRSDYWRAVWGLGAVSPPPRTASPVGRFRSYSSHREHHSYVQSRKNNRSFERRGEGAPQSAQHLTVGRRWPETSCALTTALGRSGLTPGSCVLCPDNTGARGHPTVQPSRWNVHRTSCARRREFLQRKTLGGSGSETLRFLGLLNSAGTMPQRRYSKGRLRRAARHGEPSLPQQTRLSARHAGTGS